MSSIQGGSVLSSSTVEISLDDAIQSLLVEEEIADFHVQGSDGTLVVANRSMLAARSPVFRKMLFGEFAEATKSVVELKYSSSVLHAMVEYIYTNEAKVFHTTSGGFNAIVPTMVALVDAAQYYELFKLRAKAEEFIATMVHENPHLALSILKACQSHGAAVAAVQELCLAVVKASPRVFLKGDGNTNGIKSRSTIGGINDSIIGLMSTSQIETLLKDHKFQGDELTLFLMLEAWVNGGVEEEEEEEGSSEETKQDDTTTATPVSRKGRTARAMQLAKHLRLELIDPIELSTIVAQSGLVSPDQLCNAYASQALKARHNRGIHYNIPRHVIDIAATSVAGAAVATASNQSGAVRDLGIIPSSTNDIYEDDDFDYHSPQPRYVAAATTAVASTATPRTLFSFNDWNNENKNPFGFFGLFCPPFPVKKDLPRFWRKESSDAAGGGSRRGRGGGEPEASPVASPAMVDTSQGQHTGTDTVELTFEAMTSMDTDYDGGVHNESDDVLSEVPHEEEEEKNDKDEEEVFEDTEDDTDTYKHGLKVLLGTTEAAENNIDAAMNPQFDDIADVASDDSL
jgi:hypothetical protein